MQYEDQLPPTMTDAEYDAWFALSRVEDGVRVGPKFDKTPKGSPLTLLIFRARIAELESQLTKTRADAARLLDKFRMVAIELHIHKHWANTGVRWEDCEDCAELRAALPEYAEGGEKK